MFVSDKYQPPIINTYRVTSEMRQWRVLNVSEQKGVNQKRCIVAAVIMTLFAATAASIYFLATTSHGTTSNSIYISVVAVGVGGITVLAVAFGSATPVLKIPKFEEPGVSEAMISRVRASGINKLCDHLEQNGGVSPLVQRGFLLPDQGKVLTDYMEEKAQDTPIQPKLDELKQQWKGIQTTITEEYAKDVTLEQFSEYEGFGGVSRTSRVVSGGTLEMLLKSYKAYKRVVEGFEAQTLAPGQLGQCKQYTLAKEGLENLETQWQEFRQRTIPNFRVVL